MTYDRTIYSDFDGVYNAPEPPFEDLEQVVLKVQESVNFLPESNIIYSRSVVNRMEKFREDFNAEWVWATSWNEGNRISVFVDHLKAFTDGRVLPAVLHTAQVSRKEWTQWKADAIIADQAVNERPFVWIDDHAHEHWGDEVAAATTAPSLFITPQSNFGLTVDELDRIEEFLSEN